MKKICIALLIFTMVILLRSNKIQANEIKSNDPSNLEVINAIDLDITPGSLNSHFSTSSTAASNKSATIHPKKATTIKLGDYKNSVQAANSHFMYRGFSPLSHGLAITYDKPVNDTSSPQTFLEYNKVKETINLDYKEIGTYIPANGNSKRQASVKIKLSNIIVGSSPYWTNDNTHKPWIEISNIFTDGIVYGNINKIDIELIFYDSISGTNLNLLDNGHSMLTYSSLNAYPNTSLVGTNKREDMHEFIGILNKSNVSKVTLAKDTLLSYHEKASKNANIGYDKGTFYAQKAIEGVDFTDYLLGKTLNRSSVNFTLSGITHSFKFGSTYGRGWNTFS